MSHVSLKLNKRERKCSKKNIESLKLGIFNVSKYCNTQKPQQPLSIFSCEIMVYQRQNT